MPSFKEVTVSIEPPNVVRLGGTVTTRDPQNGLGHLFRAIHEAALGDALAEIELDLTELKFVNSSAIRLFLDWSGWIKESGIRYRLRVRTRQSITWQRTSLMAMSAVAEDVLTIEPV